MPHILIDLKMAIYKKLLILHNCRYVICHPDMSYNRHRHETCQLRQTTHTCNIANSISVYAMIFDCFFYICCVKISCAWLNNITDFRTLNVSYLLSNGSHCHGVNSLLFVKHTITSPVAHIKLYYILLSECIRHENVAINDAIIHMIR